MKKKIIKTVTAVLLMTTLLSMTACGNANGKKDSTGSNTDNNADSNQNVVEGNEDIDVMTTEGFYPISDCVYDYELTRTDYTTDPTSSIITASSFVGEFDISPDGEAAESISVNCDRETSTGSININDAVMEFLAFDIYKVGIIDLNPLDQYAEVIVYDGGPSDDPCVILFTYVNGEIYNMEKYYATGDYDQIMIDKNYKIIDSYGYIDFLDVQIVTQYKEVTYGETSVQVELHEVDYTDALNKTYTVSEDMLVAFAETDNTDLSAAYDVIELNNYAELKQGDKIILVAADPLSEVYYVELPDGRRGVFTDRLAG